MPSGLGVEETNTVVEPTQKHLAICHNISSSGFKESTKRKQLSERSIEINQITLDQEE